MSTKQDYVVSNTITILPSMFSVINNDLHKRHGRYTYQYPQSSTVVVFSGAGIATESRISLELDTAPTFSISALSTTDTTPTISGTSDAIGSMVLIYVTDSASVLQSLSAVVQGDGTYSVDVPTPLALGTYTVYASVSSGSVASVETATEVLAEPAP